MGLVSWIEDVRKGFADGDLLVRWHRLGSGPSLDVGGCAQAFAVAEQVVEVCLQVGQVGDVGAEMVAAHAAEPERAGVHAGFDVARLAADAEGDDDFAGGAAGVFGVQQRLGLSPDAVAVPVELQRGDAVDGLAAPCLTYALATSGIPTVRMPLSGGSHDAIE
ncbi:hypothetical protein ACFWY5_57670 [Nonomuraea sp. NPDC059007]|uniref:hypothetical protein n=1 Tax=Nonomuraea sp. NPDC059007 TaxID=3346692 RepID=UPI0036AEB201